MSAGIGSALTVTAIKVGAEKPLGKLFDDTKAIYVNWRCGKNQLHQVAQSHISTAYRNWDNGDVSGFHAEYRKAVTIYEKSEQTCASNDAIFHLMFAYCGGYGGRENTALGRRYMSKLRDDPRLTDIIRNTPDYCSDR